MTRHLQGFVLPLLLLLVALSYPAFAATAPAERSELLAQLREAKRVGDMAWALDLEQALADLRGESLEFADPRRPGPDEVAVVFADDTTAAPDKWQGNDVLVAGTEWDDAYPSLAADRSGNLFCAVEIFGDWEPETRRIYLYRSQDGGESWSTVLWLTSTYDLSSPSLTVGLGNSNQLLLAYQRGQTEIIVFRMNLDDLDLYDSTVVHTNVLGAANPCIVTDSDEYGGWYGYLVFNSKGIDNWTLQSARTLNQGGAWSASTTIGSYCGYPDVFYDASEAHPAVDFGFDTLQVVWDDHGTSCTNSDRDVFTMQSTSFGASWDEIMQLTDTADADDRDPSIALIKNPGVADPHTIVVSYTSESPYYPYDQLDAMYAYSVDGGGLWTRDECLSCYSNIEESLPDVAIGVHPGYVHAVYMIEGWGVYTATAAVGNPGDLAFAGTLASYPGMTLFPDVAVNGAVAGSQEIAVVWCSQRDYGDYDVYFDGGATVGLGTIAVNPTPPEAAGAWRLYNAYAGFDSIGAGAALFTGMEEGDYTLVWLETPEWTPQSADVESRNLSENTTLEFAVEFKRIAPRITAVADVGNDQGGRLRLVWDRAGYDAPGIGADVTGYTVFRRQDADKLAGWDWLEWLPAYGDDVYQYVAPSLCDSTAEGGACPTVFMVRASTTDVFTFFDSAPDSGCSVDNLAPNVPAGFQADYGAGVPALSWLESEDGDFRFFKIYRGATPDFVPDPANPVHLTVGTAWLDPNGGYDAYYKVSAVDFAGNESPAVGPQTTTGAHDVPTAYALRANVPNPFNPSTTIAFDLPTPSSVTLRVHDLTGRVVRTLLDGASYGPGRHAVVWDGEGDAGRGVAAGLYLYRIETAAGSAARRMLLVR